VTPTRLATALARPSYHQEPIGAVAIARHYIRDVVSGANDGLITTFAVVAGVTGGGLSARDADRRPGQSPRRWPVDGRWQLSEYSIR
jgi:hypothetical protein